MTRVVVAPTSVAMFPEGGGHLWVFLQWARGLERIGCEVHWLECIEPKYERQPTSETVATFLATLAAMGMEGRVIVYQQGSDGSIEFLNVDEMEAARVLDGADLLLNFKYDLSDAVLERVRRTALVDIDPGLLQFWWSKGQLTVQPHDHYFTTAEHVGTDRVPDCGVAWNTIRPVVDTVSWGYERGPTRDAFTTVTNWFGEWLTDGADLLVHNSKRDQFLGMVDLPTRTAQPLELAVCFGDNVEDEVDRSLLLANGWLVRHSYDVSRSPQLYRDYIRGSRGELSCAKPSCLLFQNAWISDRTLCYLSSGRPSIVQHTGPSAYLPDREGLFRFTTEDDALDALDEVTAHYEHHREAARHLAETYFDAAVTCAQVLDVALAGSR